MSEVIREIFANKPKKPIKKKVTKKVEPKKVEVKKKEKIFLGFHPVTGEKVYKEI